MIGICSSAAQAVLFARDGASVTLQASADSKMLVLSGAPIMEPVAAYGPFVMNTQAEIREAVADFQAGKFGAVAD